MATGGGGEGDDNPFSFKKFIKKSSRAKRSSDSDWEDESDEEHVVDLLDTSSHSKESSEPKAKKTDENPFSFKRFLQSGSGGPKESSSNGRRLVTLDLANDLPDFVQDHYLTDRDLTRGRTRSSATASEVCLPDFALDSAVATSGHLDECQPDVYDSPLSERAGACGIQRPKGSGISSLNGHVGPSTISLERRNSGFHGMSDFEPDLETNPFVAADRRHVTHTPVNPGGGGPGPGGLPDFLSDSSLRVLNLPAAAAAGNDDVPSGFDNRLLDIDDKSVQLQRLQDENHDLRRQLSAATETAHRESTRATDLLTDLENLRKHEADETAALENMVQQVEANLQTTLQRAVNAENVIVKLKQEIKTLQGRVSSLAAENEMLRAAPTSPLKEKTIQASQQIHAAATSAEQLLKQLLSGVETLKMVSSVLASTDQVTDVPVDGADASCSNSGGSSAKKQSDASS